MRAMVDAKAFSEALHHVSKVIQKSTIPVLEGALVRFENGRCSLTGMDFTTCLTVSLPSWGDDFSFVLHKPPAAVKACRYFDGELSIEAHETNSKYSKVVLSCGQRSGEFNVLPVTDYPELPERGESVSFQANAANLLKRIERVKYAVREPVGSSYRVDQTCVQFSGNDIFCVDGWRAACDTDLALTFPKPFLTWGNSLSFLKLMGNQEVSICVDGGHIWFSSEDVSLCCRREGLETFPLMSAIPKTFREEFYVNPAEFARELSYLKNSVQSKRDICVCFCGGKMLASSGSNRCATEVRMEGRSDLTVGFSLRFMEDALKQFKGEDFVKIKFSSEIGPIVIEADGRNDFAMVLPVNLKKAAA